MQKQLTQGPVMPTMLRFAVPMILGDLLQQCYNIADTLVVGRFIGTNALAAVGSAFTLMTFLTSILLGLAMGSGTVFSIKFGQKDDTGLREGVLAAFVLLAIVTAVLTGAVYLGFEGIIWFLRLPAEIAPLMRTYLKIVFAGLAAIFLYNYFASLLRWTCGSSAGWGAAWAARPRRRSLRSMSPAWALPCTPGCGSRWCGRLPTASSRPTA